MNAPHALGHRLVHHAEVASTMDEARALALDGAPEGTVVSADRQVGGRGRDGRAWASPAGGLWFTVVLRPRAPPATWGLLPLVGGVAVADALIARGVPAGVKWPNDVLLPSGRKVAGVLCESRLGDDAFALMGVGVNVNVRADAFAPDVRAVAGTLLDHGGPFDERALLADVLAALDARYARAIREGARAEFLDAYRRVSVTLGRDVRPRNGPAGRAVDVREDGALVVERANGARVSVHAGDVDVPVE